MIKQMLAFAVAGVILILYATPAFYLRNGPDRDTPENVTQYLGTPSQSTDNPDGTTVSLYRVEKIPPLCIEYVLTFKNKLSGEDASLQAITVKQVLQQWTWRWCSPEQAEKKG